MSVCPVPGRRGTHSTDLDRSFDDVLTHDPAPVLEVASSLLARTLPAQVDEDDDTQQGAGRLVSSVGVASASDA